MRKKKIENPLKNKIAKRGMEALEKQWEDFKPTDKPVSKRGRKKKTATTEESSAVVSEMEKTQTEFIPNFWTHPDKEPFNIPNQSAKADCGKPQLSLVPTKILEAIARVREYGNRKYKSKDNWKTVEIERYRDAAFRHWAQYIDDPQSRDEESGLPHLWHVACNISFLVSLEDYDVVQH